MQLSAHIQGICNNRWKAAHALTDNQSKQKQDDLLPSPQLEELLQGLVLRLAPSPPVPQRKSLFCEMMLLLNGWQRWPWEGQPLSVL